MAHNQGGVNANHAAHLSCGRSYLPATERDTNMQVERINGHTTIQLASGETYAWAHQPGRSWPNSVVAGQPLWAEFDPDGNLIDMGDVDGNVPLDEFNAIIEDALGNARPTGLDIPLLQHPAPWA